MKINIKEVFEADKKESKNWLAEALEGSSEAERSADEVKASDETQSLSESEINIESETDIEADIFDQEISGDDIDQEVVCEEEFCEKDSSEEEFYDEESSDEEASEEEATEEKAPEEKAPEEEALEEEPPEEDPSENEPPEEEDYRKEEELSEEADMGGEPLNKRKRSGEFKKYGWIGGIAGSFIILLLAVFIYTSMIPREVNATIDGREYKAISKEYTVEDFLKQEKISYCDDDYLSVPAETYIYDGIEFNLKHAVDFKVTADGKTKSYKSLETTVGDALAGNGIKVGDRDIVNPSYDTALEDNMTIIIQRVTSKQTEIEETVPFNTVTKNDSSLSEGSSKVVNEGVNGLDRVVYEIIYIDGVEYSRTEVSRTTIKEAEDKVVANGTKISFNGKTYSRKLVVKAYSYTGGGRTAMGTKARVGEIAVDPKVIPLGSTVYIEGVGARRAEDTGGNIKGNTIDIYMNSVSECRRWGVRYVTIYIK